jgi:hypothetical protein
MFKVSLLNKLLFIDLALIKLDIKKKSKNLSDFESCADILITSYWLHVELGKNI